MSMPWMSKWNEWKQAQCINTHTHIYFKLPIMSWRLDSLHFLVWSSHVVFAHTATSLRSQWGTHAHKHDLLYIYSVECWPIFSVSAVDGSHNFNHWWSTSLSPFTRIYCFISYFFGLNLRCAFVFGGNVCVLCMGACVSVYWTKCGLQLPMNEWQMCAYVHMNVFTRTKFPYSRVYESIFE